MAFVNEYISLEDVNKYRIDEIEKRAHFDFNGSRHWTIDRQRDIYFREMQRGREEFHSHTLNAFYWKGKLIWVRLQGLSAEQEAKAEGQRFGYDESADPKGRFFSIKLKHWSEDGSGELSPESMANRYQMIRDLKEALEASQGGFGVYASDFSRPSYVTLIVTDGA